MLHNEKKRGDTMAKAILNGNEIFGNVHLGEGGGASPTFSETVLADNSSLASSFTLSDDMSNYDFIVFKTKNSSSLVETKSIITPTTLASVFSLTTNRFTLGEINTNQYVIYSVSTNTFTKGASRNLDIIEVVGLKCTNMTVSETAIYTASSLTANNIEVTGTGILTDNDFLLLGGNASGRDDIGIGFAPLSTEDFGIGLIVGVLNYYNGSRGVTITDTKASAGNYLYIVGIKFT